MKFKQKRCGLAFCCITKKSSTCNNKKRTKQVFCQISNRRMGKKSNSSKLVTGGIGFIGLGLNARFKNKLWNFIKNAVESRQGQAKKSDDELEDPVEISKGEFD